MKNLIFAVVFVAQCVLAYAESNETTGTIKVTITGIQNQGGILRIALFTPEDDFLIKPTYWKDVALHTESQVVEEFGDIPYGTYAVSIYHDLNGNGDLDANLFMIPKEPIGFSNEYFPKFGPPKFKNASFTFDRSTLNMWVNLRTY